MRLIKSLFTFLIVCCFSWGIKAQNYLFTADNLSEQLKSVEQLVHYKIDSIRTKKKLKGLQNDKYLTEAAKLHSDWMGKTGKLTHIQNKAKTKTPQKRVLLAGGSDSFIGENVAFTLFNIEITNKKGKRFTNTSYEAIANDLVKMWRHSKGHYKNIITKEYTKTGIALSVDFKTNKIYATQVFGGQ